MDNVRRWICFSNSKTTFVKIVHPGGHVELHDRPVLASEILNRNPRSCVAHPNIFRQPWAAVVEPETTLMPGQKFYVVPQHTLRKLQSLASESSSPGMVPVEFPTPQDNSINNNNRENNEKDSTCGSLFRRNGSSKSDSDGCFGRRRLITGFTIIARSYRDDETKSSWSSLGSSDMKALRRNKSHSLDSTSATKIESTNR